MIDVLLMMGLGFLGSFGHCLGMCGPLTVAFALSRPDGAAAAPRSPSLRFHLCLNLGRILSYALVGALIGAIGSVLVAGGQLAGIGSDLRRWIAILTGLMLIWFGIVQLNPKLLPQLPLLNPIAQRRWHDRLSRFMLDVSQQTTGLTPVWLGLVWGLIPCGFLYAAQIKAAETTEIWRGSLTMLAFGVGTMPTMLGVGIVSSWLSRDRRSQLFRLGGWITVLMGGLTLLRTGAVMVDYTGYGALICLLLTLIARPLSRLWPALLQYRRGLGVGAFLLSCAHLIHTLDHSWGWNVAAIGFMLPQHQWGIGLGGFAFALLLPLALTSFDGAQRRLGPYWRPLHLLALPALALVTGHCLLIGSRFLGRAQLTWVNAVMVGGLAIALLLVAGLRSPAVWSWLSLGEVYVPPISPQPKSDRSDP